MVDNRKICIKMVDTAFHCFPIIPTVLGSYSLRFELLMCLQTNIHEKLYRKRESLVFSEDKNFPPQLLLEFY